jgi:putative transcriptional regulator
VVCFAVLIAALCIDNLSADEYNPYERKLGRGVFLVASRNLLDPNFSQTVVLLIEYGTQGAVGLVVNRETDVRLRDVVPEKEILKKHKGNVFVGGPVGVDQLLILVRTEMALMDSHRVTDNVYAVSSLDVLEDVLIQDKNGVTFRAYAGYAGWAPGQLETEVARGDWFVVASDADSVFSREPESVWPRFIKQSTLQWTKLSGLTHSVVTKAVEVLANRD